MNHPIASELSYWVVLKRQRELNGVRDVPKVTAPVQTPIVRKWDGETEPVEYETLTVVTKS